MAEHAASKKFGSPFYAYYSRYGYKEKWGWPTEAHDLLCPSCGAEEITILEEAGGDPEKMLGDLAQCWVCKREFTVTGNCWKSRKIRET
jgi:hypothetical protein